MITNELAKEVRMETPHEKARNAHLELIARAESLVEAATTLVQKAKLAANRVADLGSSQNPHHGPEVAAHLEAQERLTDALNKVNGIVHDVRTAYGVVRDTLPEAGR